MSSSNSNPNQIPKEVPDVIGIKFGSRNTVLGIVKNHAVDTLTLSNREIASMVSFTKNNRTFEDSAQISFLKNISSTYINLNRLIGLKYESNFYGEDTKNEACYVTVNLNTFYDMVPAGFQCHGVIHKDVLELYKTGEIDELYQDEDLDFNNMTDIEKQCYEYFEWDNKYSWFYYFKKLKDIVTNTVNKYYNNEFEFETNETRLVVFCL